MSLKGAYRERIETETDKPRARLELLKARQKDLGNANDDAWQEMKVGTEKAWDALTASCKKGANRFKNER